ncbi:WS/DGAT domain-containing protein [Aldersonia sp. NBC_00410]|uniref:wax ester/triacylglycerol synthase domain-containing protein n=1 Tax=Aldersonia sp. NBC_00410 TaxID=2975954 RepID=UPI002252EB66|nr:wax ester/triacylglycerol synthase domain-containing protein [Aldersonia sp. NBC_00410]MCX5041648.1 WS/DGAT domain-containing protein [Aldersonia sp. NBC_00410]
MPELFDHADPHHPMTDLDMQFLRLERRAQPMHWAITFELDEHADHLSLGELRTRVRERSAASHRFDILVPDRGWRRPVPSTMAADSDVDQVEAVLVDDHAALQVLLGRMLSRQLDRTRPLWRVTLVTVEETGRQYIVLRGHHSMADAISAGGFAWLFADSDVNSSQFSRFLDSSHYEVPPIGVRATARSLTGLGRSWREGAASGRLPKVSRTGERRARIIKIPTVQFRACARAHSASLMELLCASVGAALSRNQFDPKHPVSLFRTTIPVTLDPELRHVGNAVSMAMLNIRGDEPDLAKQFVHVRTQLESAKRDRTELATYQLSRTPRLPWPVERFLTRGYFAALRPDIDVTLSPAFSNTSSALGRKVSAVYPLGPLMGYPLAINALVLGDTVAVGITADATSLHGYEQVIGTAILDLIMAPADIVAAIR